MRQALQTQFKVIPLAVSRACWQMGLEYRKPQVKAVIEPLPEPVQLIAKPTKQCVLCDQVKSLTAFLKSSTSADGRRSTCTVCQRNDSQPRHVRLEAKATVVSTAMAGLETLESLTARAIKSKARSAIFKAGRVCIEARYSKADAEVTFYVNDWPRHPEFVEMLLERVHSGVGTGGMQL